MKQFFLVLLLPLIFLYGCGGGGVSDKPATLLPKENPIPATVILYGSVVKGSVSGARIDIYKIENSSRGSLLATTFTGSDGNYRVKIEEWNGPVEVVATGGSYVDEATGYTKSLGQLRSFAPSLSSTEPIYLTPLTEMATILTSQTLNPATIIQGQNKVESLFSIPSVQRTSPILNPDPAKVYETRYGMVLAAISTLGFQKNTDPVHIAKTLAWDMSDGILNGTEKGQILTIGGTQMEKDLGTKKLSSAVETYLVSKNATQALSSDETWLTNLKTSDGNLTTLSTQMFLNPFKTLLNTPTVQITGTIVPGGATLYVSRSGNLISNFTTALNGVFSINLNLTPNALNLFEIKAQSSGGSVQKNIEIRHDSIAPTIQITVPELVNTSSLSLSWSLTDVYAPPFTLKASMPSATITPTGNKLTITNLTHGNHYLSLEAKDALGNVSTREFLITADFLPPMLSIQPASVTSTNLSFPISVNEPIKSLSFRRFLKNSPPPPFTSLTTDITSFDLNFFTIQGEHQIEFTALDLAGNFGSITRFVLFDSIIPSLISSSGLPDSTNQNTIPFAFQLSEPIPLKFKATHSSGNSLSGTLASSSQIVLNSLDGLWTIDFEAVDPANNMLSWRDQLILDKTAPLPPSITASSLKTNTPTVQISVNGEASAKIITSGGWFRSLFAPATFDLPLFANTTNHFSFALEDNFTNRSGFTNLQIVHDNLPPSIGFQISTPAVGWLSSSHTIPFQITLNSLDYPASLKLDFLSMQKNYTQFTTATIQDSFLLSQIQTETFQPEIRLLAKDMIGNTTSFSQTLIKSIDTISPKIISHFTTSAFSHIGLTRSASFGFSLQKQEPFAIKKALFGSLPLNIVTTDQRVFSGFYQPKTTHPQTGNDLLTIAFSATDPAGNTTSVNSVSAFHTDTVPPSLLMITNDKQSGGWLKNSDSLLFTLVPEPAEPALQILASYNTIPLLFTTKNSGTSYTASYQFFSTHPAYVNTIPQIQLTSLSDLAGNTLTLTDIHQKIIPVLKKFDNKDPAIQSVQISYSSTKTLIIGDFLTIHTIASEEPSHSSTPLLLSGTLGSRTLSFSSTDSRNFFSTYIISALDPDQKSPPNLSLKLSDGAGNLSTSYVFPIARTIDTTMIEPVSVRLSANTSKSKKISGDILQFELGFSSVPDLKTVTASVKLSTNATNHFLTFHQGSNPYLWVSTIAIDDVDIETSAVYLKNLIREENSANRSMAKSYTLTRVFYNSTEQNLDIDTRGSLISLASISPNSGVLGISKSVVFTFYASPPSLDLSLISTYNGVSLPFTRISSSQYSATYTIFSTHTARTIPLQISNARFTDSFQRTSNLTQSTSLAFLIDTTIPDFPLIQSSTDFTSPLTPKETIRFTLSPQVSSTDTIFASAVFNSVPLHFVTSPLASSYVFISTYTVETTHADRLSLMNAPQLEKIYIEDSAGHKSPLTQTLNLSYLIDATPPALTSVAIHPSFETTLSIGSALSIEASFSSSPEKNLSVYAKLFSSGILNLTNIPLKASENGEKYTTNFLIPDNLNANDLITSLLVRSEDPAGNTSSILKSSLKIHVDALRPSLLSTSLSSFVATSNPLFIGIGGLIEFRVKAASDNESNGVDPITQVQGKFQSTQIDFSTTDGVWWKGLYMVREGIENSVSVTHQITSVIAYDRASNRSTPISGTDLTHRIDSIRPAVSVVSPLATTTRLKISDWIRFTVTATEPTSQISTLYAIFNQKNIGFQSGASSFTGTYTVLEKDSDSNNAFPQITIFLNDLAGNSNSFLSSNLNYLIDANRPALTSLSSDPSVESTFGISKSFSLSSSFLTSPEKNLSVVSRLLSSGPLNLTQIPMISNTDGSFYTTSWTVSESLNQQDLITSFIVISTDSFGNTSELIFPLQYHIDGQKPTLIPGSFSATANTTNPSWLGIGKSVEFSVKASVSCTSGGIDPIAGITGKFISTPLTFSSTDGVWWKAVYTVLEGIDHSAGTTHQITSVIAMDYASNYADPLTGSGLTHKVDSIRPAISSVSANASTTKRKISDLVNFSVFPSEGISQVSTVIASYNSVTIGFSSSSTSFVGTYTVSPQDPDSNGTPAQISIILSDLASNSITYLSTDLFYLIDANPPVISEISHTATTPGSLGIYSSENTTNSQINFSVFFSPQETDVSVQASYNRTAGGDVPLLFQFHSASGSWISTYTVFSTHISTQIPLQLTVQATDLFGNTTSFTTTDILKTIDTSYPQLVSATSLATIQIRTQGDNGLYLGIGDSLTLSLLLSPSSTDTILLTGIYNSTSLNFSTTDSLHWISTYTVLEGHQSLEAIQYPSALTAKDQAGNTTNLVMTTGIHRMIDATRPTVNTLIVGSTTKNESLTPQDSLIFELYAFDQGSLESGGYVTGSYNSSHLLWSESSFGCYAATYTVETTHADTLSPLQISSVFFFDSAGNRTLNPSSSVAELGGVTQLIGTSIPLPPIVSDLSALSETSNYTFTIQGENNATLYANHVLIGRFSSTTTTSFTTSAGSGEIRSFSFYQKDIHGLKSSDTVAHIKYSQLKTPDFVDSSASGLKTTALEIKWIQESATAGLYFVLSRAGVGKFDFNALTYTSLDSTLIQTNWTVLAQSPADTNLLLLGSDSGIYKTTNSGLTWTQPSSALLNDKKIRQILFHPQSPTTVWIATDSGVFKSTDSGDTFSSIHSNGPDPDIAANRNVHAIIWESSFSRLYTGMESGLHYTDLSGTSWTMTQTDEASLLKLSANSSHPQTLIGLSANALIRTTNLLSVTPSWEDILPPDLFGNPVIYRQTSQSGLGYLASTTGVFKTTDHGSHWSSGEATSGLFAHWDYTSMDTLSTATNRLLLGGHEHLYRILDTDTTPWTLSDVTSLLPPKISFLNAYNEDTLYALTQSWIYKYTISTDSWTRLSSLSPSSNYHFAKAGNLFLWVGSDRSGLTTMGLNGGTQFTQAVPITAISTKILDLVIHPGDDNIVLTASDEFGLFYSVNRGSSWTASTAGIGVQTITALGISPTTACASSCVFAATSTSVWYEDSLSNVASFTWASPSVCNTLSSVEKISVVSDTNGVYLIQNGELLNLSNVCTSFTTLTASFSPRVLSFIVIVPTNISSRIIYLGTDSGLYRSTDSGTSFSRLGSIYQPVVSLELISENSDYHKIAVGTHAGLWIFEDRKPR